MKKIKIFAQKAAILSAFHHHLGNNNCEPQRIIFIGLLCKPNSDWTYFLDAVTFRGPTSIFIKSQSEFSILGINYISRWHKYACCSWNSRSTIIIISWQREKTLIWARHPQQKKTAAAWRWLYDRMIPVNAFCFHLLCVAWSSITKNKTSIYILCTLSPHWPI